MRSSTRWPTVMISTGRKQLVLGEALQHLFSFAFAVAERDHHAGVGAAAQGRRRPSPESIQSTLPPSRPMGGADDAGEVDVGGDEEELHGDYCGCALLVRYRTARRRG